MQFNIEGHFGEIARETGRLFHAAGEKIYLVGGAVRDLVAGETPHDLDFTTSADVKRIQKIMQPAAKFIYDKSQAKNYGTQGVILRDGTEIEITPFRRAGEPAEDEPPATFEEDLRTRDFTINAIALDVSPVKFGAVADPHGGVADFRNRILRTPAPPLETFADDPLRTLRAARFCAKYGLAPDPVMVDAIEQVTCETDWLDRVAAERAREEISKTLMTEPPSAGMRMLLDWGLMHYWLPEVAALNDTTPAHGAAHKQLFIHTMTVLDRAAEFGPADPVFRFAALLHDIGKPAVRVLENGEYTFPAHEKTGAELARKVCERLRWSNQDADRVAALALKHHRLHGYAPEWTDSAVRRALHDLGEIYEQVIAMARADISSAFPEKVAESMAGVDHFLARVDAMEKEAVLNPVPPIDGKAIMEILGAEPGPEVGKAIKYLKEKIVSGELLPGNADAAREMVRNREWE